MFVYAFVAFLQLSHGGHSHSATFSQSSVPTNCASAERVKKKLDDGNIEVASQAISMLSCYGGGELEDVYVDLGDLFMKHPAKIFSYIHINKLGKYEISDMFSMVPWRFVDHPCGRYKELAKRESLIKSLSGYERERKIALAAVISKEKEVLPYCKNAS